MMNVARARCILAGLLCALMGTGFAADNFPNKGLTLIVPYSEGGSSDTRARQIARHMATHLGQPVQVVNHAGDGGNKGTDLIAKARPDGHTFGLGNLAPMTVNRHLHPGLPFNPRTDLRAIGMIERGPLVLVVAADADVSSAEALLDKAKTTPRRLRYASAGVGGSFHLAVELLEQQVGFTAQHVPFDGGGKATDALIQKQVDFKFDGVPSAMALLAEPPPQDQGVGSGQPSPLASFAKRPDVSGTGHRWPGGIELAGPGGAIGHPRCGHRTAEPGAAVLFFPARCRIGHHPPRERAGCWATHALRCLHVGRVVPMGPAHPRQEDLTVTRSGCFVHLHSATQAY
jgi:tripartite-type tricarboxylate transporter receptor subunit TctC